MPLVLLHGLPLDGTSWAEAAAGIETPTWAPTLYHLGSTVTGWAEAVVDQIGAGPLVLVGSSVGASCALEVARLVPGRVQHLVLVGGKAGHRRDPAQHAAVHRIVDEEGMAGGWDRIWAPLLSHPGPAVADRERPPWPSPGPATTSRWSDRPPSGS